MKSERVILDADSSDEDEEEKELFDEFVIVEKDDTSKIEDFLNDVNKKEVLEEENKLKNNDPSELIFSKKSDNITASTKDTEPKSLEDFDILQVIDKGSFGKVRIDSKIKNAL